MDQAAINILIQAVDKISPVLKQIQTNTKQTVDQMGQMKTSMQASSNELKKLQSAATATMGSLGKLKGTLASITVGAGLAGAAFKMANAAKDYALSVRQIALVTGESAQNASKLRGEFTSFGISADTATAALAKMEKNIASSRQSMIKATAEGKESTDAFTKLGISLNDLSTKGTFDIFTEIQEKMRGIDDAAERNSIAMEIFGKSAYQMTDVLTASPEKIEAVTKKLESMGLVLDQVSIDQAFAYEKAMNSMTGASSKLQIQIGNALLPALTDEIKLISSAANGFATLSSGTQEAAGTTLLMATQFGVVNVAIGLVTNSLKAMGIATKTAFGPWVLLAEAIVTATVALYNYAAAERDWEEGHTYESGGRNYYIDRNGEVKNAGTWGGNEAVLEDPMGTGVSANTGEIDEATKADVLAQNQKREDEKKKQAEDEAKKKAEEQTKAVQELIDKMKTGSGDVQSASKTAADAQREAAEAAKQAAAAQQEQARVVQENAKLIQQANNKIDNIINGIKDHMLEQTGTKLEIALNKAKETFEQTERAISNAAVQLKVYDPSKFSFAGKGGTTAGNAIYQYGAARDGMPYLLGGDGLTATDCGKLFSDAVLSVMGVEIPRRVDKLIEYAKEKGAWHPAGDGYVAQRGDGTVVLGDNHIVIDNGAGGYVGANSSTGVIEKESTTADFGDITGYISIAQLFPQAVQSMQQTQQQVQQATQAVMDTSTAISNAIPKNDNVQTIVKAANDLGAQSLLPYILGIAAVETGGGDLNAINPNAYNRESGATGLFQILEGQDVLGTDGKRHYISDMYQNYKKDPYENALAGITMLMDKINNVANGNIQKGIFYYGDGTNEYVDKVNEVANQLGGNGVNLLPLQSVTYRSPRTQEARDLNRQQYEQSVAIAQEENNIRERKQLEEIRKLQDENAGDKLKLLEDERNAAMQAAFEEESTFYKETGNQVQAFQLRTEKMNQIQLKYEADVRSEMNKESDNFMTHLDNQVKLQEKTTNQVDEYRKRELQNFIEYNQKQLDEAALTADQRVQIESQVAEKTKQLQSINAKSLDGGFDYLFATMKDYQMDTGNDLVDAWGNVTDAITSSFDNMLTENQSFTDRMKNLYINLANDILNVMMKIILKGLIMNAIMKAFGIGGGISIPSFKSGVETNGTDFSYSEPSFNMSQTDWDASTRTSLLGGFATGGDVNDEYFIVGENGPELLRRSRESEHVYPADVTRRALGNQGMQNVKIELVNESGTQLQAEQPKINFDGETYVISAVLKGISTNKMGLRDIVKGASK